VAYLLVGQERNTPVVVTPVADALRRAGHSEHDLMFLTRLVNF
jgi:hypothetical protein